jgi:hydroxymethylpyrimidine/phosphomethylpyrimidine kinase
MSSQSHLNQTNYLSTPIVLTIAGSGSGGGAGIQADIKSISATGSFACSAITAITSQNTLSVSAIFPIPIDHIESQLDAVFTDIKVISVKIGMLAEVDIIKVVAAKIRQYQPKYIVLNPVMVTTSGDLLLQENAINALKEELFPLVEIITPNLPEAAALTGTAIPSDETGMQNMVAALKALGAKAVLLKGGHLRDELESADLLITEKDVEIFSSLRINTKNTHGTGCTLSSAIASYLAQENSLHDAVFKGKSYITHAISQADQLNIGEGHGPVNHFFALNGHHE